MIVLSQIGGIGVVWEIVQSKPGLQHLPYHTLLLRISWGEECAAYEGPEGPNGEVMTTNRSERPIWHLHNVGGDWPHLRDVPGIAAYWNRALVTGGTVVIHGELTPDLERMLAHQAQVGIHPTIISIPRKSEDFYADMLNDTAFVARVKTERPLLEMFCSAPPAQDFVRHLGLNWLYDTGNPTDADYRMWGDKANLRRALTHMGMPHLFPRHVLVATPQELTRERARMHHDGVEYVVIKAPHCASGEGLVFLGRTGDHSEFVREFMQGVYGAIIEAAYQHHPFSMVYRIGSDGVTLENTSLQWMGNDSTCGTLVTFEQLLCHDMDHRGNAVGPDGAAIGPITQEILDRAIERVAPFIDHLKQSDFRGRICLDMILTEGGEIFLVECNPRASHSMYVAQVQRALSTHFGEPIFVIGANVRQLAEHMHSYEAAAAAVELCTPENPSGVLFYHVPLMPYGKCGLWACGRSFEEARAKYSSALATLTGVTAATQLAQSA